MNTIDAVTLTLFALLAGILLGSWIEQRQTRRDRAAGQQIVDQLTQLRDQLAQERRDRENA